jgi:hypothetical protein
MFRAWLKSLTYRPAAPCGFCPASQRSCTPRRPHPLSVVPSVATRLVDCRHTMKLISVSGSRCACGLLRSARTEIDCQQREHMLVTARFSIGATEPHHSQPVAAVSWRAAACHGVQFGHSAVAYHVPPSLTVVTARGREDSIPALRSSDQTRAGIRRHCARPLTPRLRRIWRAVAVPVPIAFGFLAAWGQPHRDRVGQPRTFMRSCRPRLEEQHFIMTEAVPPAHSMTRRRWPGCAPSLMDA